LNSFDLSGVKSVGFNDMNFSGWEIILVVAVLFLLFGASRLPQLAKSLGQSRKAFKEGMREAEEEERAEQEKKQLSSAVNTPEIGEVTDEKLLEELRRRAEAKQVN
jgi:sec-independent protein translocase protein TatA